MQVHEERVCSFVYASMQLGGHGCEHAYAALIMLLMCVRFCCRTETGGHAVLRQDLG